MRLDFRDPALAALAERSLSRSCSVAPGALLWGMRRALLIFLSFGAALTSAIGGFYLYVGVRALMAGNATAGALFAAFGGGGLVLALALWSMRRNLVAPKQ